MSKCLDHVINGDTWLICTYFCSVVGVNPGDCNIATSFSFRGLDDSIYT